MNLLDYAIAGILILYTLYGVYKGLLPSAFSIGAYIIAWLLALLLMPLGSNMVKGNESLYNMMLYYTEGSEYVHDIELVRTDISDIGLEQLNEILVSGNLPYPMGKEIADNVNKETFASQNINTLGDYYNQTFVCIFINILVFLLLFVAIRVIIAFVINGIDYAWKLPKLRSGDAILGGALGLIHGILTVFLIFMLLPIALTILGQFEYVTNLVENSFFAPFFYRTNFLLSMMPGH